ncbi:Fructose-2,6-bisphosphatase [Xylographa bjoerkii]|nr:Fructose-2,6-bisphosphatase [Xylographa bjoerkii]
MFRTRTNQNGVQVEDTRIAVVMVGLPARGKSLIAQKVVRYLRWLSVHAKTFNVGTYRRADTPQPTADFFDTSNKEGERLRHAAAEAAVADMIKWFNDGNGIVAILDATNSTKERRRWVYDRCEEENIQTLFVESKCDDEALIMSNILEVKTTSPDYKGQDPELAAQDFRNRIRNYEKVYQTIDEEEKDLSYVKLIDVGQHVIINQIKDYLQSRVVYYLMNLHIKPRSIWLSRHGESEFNLEGKIGGDANISPRGELYARTLPSLVDISVGDDRKLTIWTSTLKRTIQTARFLAASPRVDSKLEWKALDELDSGVCDGLTYEEISNLYPEDFAARDEDKYNYRYRGGESYRDVVIRLEPIIMELERSENVIIVTHQAVLRCIYAYYMNVPQEKSPWMEVPLHTLIKLTPRAYHTQEERYKADIPASSFTPVAAQSLSQLLAVKEKALADYVFSALVRREDQAKVLKAKGFEPILFEDLDELEAITRAGLEYGDIQSMRPPLVSGTYHKTRIFSDKEDVSSYLKTRNAGEQYGQRSADLVAVEAELMWKEKMCQVARKGSFFSATGRFSWLDMAQELAHAGFVSGILESARVRSITLEEAAERWTGGNVQLAELSSLRSKHVSWDKSKFECKDVNANEGSSRTKADMSRELGWKASRTEKDLEAHFKEEFEVISR